MELKYPLTVDTLGKVRALKGSISVNCLTCNKHTMLDMDKLIERLGEDHGCMDADLRPHFYCKDCLAAGRDDKRIKFIHHSNSKPQSGQNAYAKAKGE